MKQLTILSRNLIVDQINYKALEFNGYLDKLDGKIYVASQKERRSTIRLRIREYIKQFPQYGNKIYSIKDFVGGNKLAYMLFLGDAYHFLPRLEGLQIPFVFTLYPGGGFGINGYSDKKLRQVCQSQLLKGIIVTQENTFEYVKKFVPTNKVFMIYGSICPTDFYRNEYQGKEKYGKDKVTFDICFTAHKYTSEGKDKGYDTFIKVAKKLIKISEDYQFHVIGRGFDSTTIDVRSLGKNIRFYGSQGINFFPKFYKNKDIILSPNIPFKITCGSFDGFPTNCCSEAGMLGTVVLCTDELNLNTSFVNKKDIIIINRNLDEIIATIETLKQNPKEMYLIGENGRHKFLEIFDLEKQMNERIRILEKYL